MAGSSTAVHISAFRLVQSPRRIRRFAIFLLLLLVALIAGMLFLPWQQTSRGTGRVIAYFPTERPQTIESPIYGRVVRWGENIVEGAPVKKGQFILEIRDNDQGRAQRLTDQVASYTEKSRLSHSKSDTYGRQVLDLTEAKNMLNEAGKQLIEAAKQKVAAEQQGLKAAIAAEVQARANNERQQQLFAQGIQSGKEAEIERRKYEEALAKLEAAKAYVEEAKNVLKAKEHELEQKAREAESKIDYSRAMQQEALGEVQLVNKDLLEIQGKQAQFESRMVEAPRDGLILRLFANEDAEMLKEGDPLFTIVPDINDHAVELFVDGNDIALVSLEREVRLQFEGFPAVQFAAGWPTAARGTFGGKVVAIDATDNGKGKFRLLVRPIEGESWPEERFLRQGVRTNGWIILNQVTLGYEIWRQLNGFPPVYGDEQEAGKSGGKGAKKVKLPK